MCVCMHIQHTFQRVHIQTILIKRNNFLKSTSSPKITSQIHSEDTILYCLADCEFSLVYCGFQPIPGVYWYINKYDLVLDLIKKQGHIFLIEEQRQHYLLKFLDKVLETQCFFYLFVWFYLYLFPSNSGMRAKHLYPGGKLLFQFKKIVNFWRIRKVLYGYRTVEVILKVSN